jgi:hypothetical protein
LTGFRFEAASFDPNCALLYGINAHLGKEAGPVEREY